MSIVAGIRKMLAAGIDLETALLAAEVFESDVTPLSPRQARNQRYYEAKRLKASEKRLTKTVQDVSDANRLNSDAAADPLARVRDNITNSEIILPVVVEVSASERVSDDWPDKRLAETLVAEIASPRLDPQKSPGLVTTAGRILAWKRDGASWAFDVIPVIQNAVRKTGPPIGTWKYFDAAIAQSIADNRQALTIPKAQAHERPHTDKRAAKDANIARAFAAADRVADAMAER